MSSSLFRGMNPAKASASLTPAEAQQEPKRDAAMTEEKRKEDDSVKELWQTLDTQLRLNIGNSLKCGICLSSMTEPVRTSCVHAFCKDCIHASLMSGNKKCPECNSTITKRSLQSFEYLETLSDTYKTALREFGLVPTTYNPNFTTMTQKISSQNNDDEVISPQGLMDRFDAATCWQQKTLPFLPNVPQMQKDENNQVVAANQKACKSFLVRKELPTTQEVQEGAREQQWADDEWNQQQSDKDENPENDEFLTAQEESQYSSSRRVSFQTGDSPGVKKKAPPNAVATTAINSSVADETITPRQTNVTEKKVESDLPFEANISPIQVQHSQTLLSMPTPSPREDEKSHVKTPVSSDTAAETATQSHLSMPTPTPERTVQRTEVTGMSEDSFGALHLLPEEQKFHNDTQTQEDADSEDDEDKTQNLKSDQSADQDSPSHSLSSAPSLSLASADAPRQYRLKSSNEIVNKWNKYASMEEDGKRSSPRASTKLGKMLTAATSSNIISLGNISETGDLKPAANDGDPSAGTALVENTDALQETVDADPEAEINNENVGGHEKPAAKPAPAQSHSSATEDVEMSESEDAFATAAESLEEDGDVAMEEDEGAPAAASRSWNVGDIVDVQSRTWPGINKPGGVARIAKVDDDGRSYDVTYILGGKEQGVASVFISDSGDQKPTNERRRRRTEGGELPMHLLQALEADGCDITGNRPIKTPRVKRQRIGSSKTPPRRNMPALKDSTNDAPMNAKVAKAKPVMKRKSRASFFFGNCSLPLADSQDFAKADAQYLQALEYAVQKENTLTVVPSSVDAEELKILKEMCSKPLANGVKLKFSDSFAKNSTTICLVPVDFDKKSGDVSPKLRTFKAMRSALAGIPMVSTEWIAQITASEDEKIKLPPLVVRSLTVKTYSGSDHINGVARLAVAKNRKFLSGVNLFFCGNFPRKLINDMHILSKDAGAKILETPGEVFTVLKAEQPLVVVCHNSNIAPDRLEKELRVSLEKSPGQIMIVQRDWLFDSISCTKALPPDDFSPQATRHRPGNDLWKLCCK